MKRSRPVISRLVALAALSPSPSPTDASHLDALHLFRRAHRRGAPLAAEAFPPLLFACRSFPSLGRQAHALMVKSAADLHRVPATALLDVYSRCGLLRYALDVFDGMSVRDSIAWNALISCLVRHGLPYDAISAFRAMAADGGPPFTGFTLCSMLKACASLRAVRLGKQIHARVIGDGNDSLVMATAIIDFYSGCGMIQEAFDVFNRLNSEKDLAIYNALISACIQNRRFKEAFSVLGLVRPNEITLTCALSACSECLSLSYGKQAHCVMVRHGFDSDTTLCNAIVDMYAKCGELTSGRISFEQIHHKNVVSWTSMIAAYGSHGRGVEAWKLFKRMQEEEISGHVSPNAVTFLSVLSACGHSGLVDEGRECFFAMQSKHGIDPGPEHYACFIYLLGRAGRIEEAWKLYCGLILNPDNLTSAVCIAMLNACKANMDLARGEQMARHLLSLDPDNPGSYVLLSNFYAACGQWLGAEDLRRMMMDRGLKKEAGNSQFELPVAIET
ncbi:hypothetical protein B296_00049367 [Ensete ventricosum]|uniref:Pentacotripeptide-repeat region of PRORP domain-containing protein n=1 Tax=Ensete ventricosum TaxID=4639 RepID=A0A426XAH1_ENSVE|nr:hypothetical protein B296_00049367 [Ensete ventricosum]